MNTHILSDVELLCDRVAIIVKGEIRYEGSTDDFLAGGQRETELVLAQVPPALAALLEQRLGARLRGLGDRIEARVA